MKRYLNMLFITLFSFTLIGCSSDDEPTNTKYDFADYIISSEYIVKTWDAYDYDLNGTRTDTFEARTTIESNNVITTTYLDSNDSSVETYTYNQDFITITYDDNTSIELNRNILLGDTLLNDITFIKYHSVFEPMDGNYTYYNVIEIGASDVSSYYSKGIGHVGDRSVVYADDGDGIEYVFGTSEDYCNY